jgi:hypothetical protein
VAVAVVVAVAPVTTTATVTVGLAVVAVVRQQAVPTEPVDKGGAARLAFGCINVPLSRSLIARFKPAMAAMGATAAQAHKAAWVEPAEPAATEKMTPAAAAAAATVAMADKEVTAAVVVAVPRLGSWTRHPHCHRAEIFSRLVPAVTAEQELANPEHQG